MPSDCLHTSPSLKCKASAITGPQGKMSKELELDKDSKGKVSENESDESTVNNEVMKHLDKLININESALNTLNYYSVKLY